MIFTDKPLPQNPIVMLVPEAGPSTDPNMSGPSIAEKNQDPPPYSAPERRTTGPSARSLRGVRVNHINIEERHAAIKGAWTIDPNLRIPESLLSPVAEGSKRENLRLVSQYNSVDAIVGLQSDTASRSTLVVESGHHNVKVNIVDRQNQSFHLIAKSKHGKVSVRIPRDFQGPVTYTTNQGSIAFSRDVHSHLLLFNRTDGVGKGFIGDWASSGYGDLVEADGDEGKARWTGDELVLASDHHNIKVVFSDEEPKPREVDLLAQDFRELGPIGFIVNGVTRNIKKGFQAMAHDDSVVEYRPLSKGRLQKN